MSALDATAADAGRARHGWWLAGSYLAVVAVVSAYLAYRFIWAPANSELLGVYLILLSMPWSMLGFRLLDGAGGAAVGIALVALGVAANAYILYRVGGGRGRSSV